MTNNHQVVSRILEVMPREVRSPPQHKFHIEPRTGSQRRTDGIQHVKDMIAALQVSFDGFIQGPNGEKDWVDSRADAMELIPEVDTFVLGGRMYRDYAEYWESIYDDPQRVPPI